MENMLNVAATLWQGWATGGAEMVQKLLSVFWGADVSLFMAQILLFSTFGILLFGMIVDIMRIPASRSLKDRRR